MTLKVPKLLADYDYSQCNKQVNTNTAGRVFILILLILIAHYITMASLPHLNPR